MSRRVVRAFLVAGVALACVCALPATAQSGDGQKPVTPPAQQGGSGSPGGGNQFPEDTTNVPVMPSRENPTPPSVPAPPAGQNPGQGSGAGPGSGLDRGQGQQVVESVPGRYRRCAGDAVARNTGAAGEDVQRGCERRLAE